MTTTPLPSPLPRRAVVDHSELVQHDESLAQTSLRADQA